MYPQAATAVEKTLSHKLEDARNTLQLRIVKALKEYLYAVQHRLGGKMIYPESLPVKNLLKLLYPCLIRLDEYLLKASSEANDLKSIENRLPLVAESLDSRGLYIFDDGFRYVVWFGFLTFVGIECFVDQLVAPIKPIIGQYMAKYLLACSGPVVTKYLDIYVAYILSYKTNIENLLKQVKKLKATRDLVLQAVEDAKRRGEVAVRDEVEKWLSSVDRLTGEATKFFEYKGDANSGWFCWLYGLLMSRYQLSKMAKKMIEHLVQLQADGIFAKVSN
ncbi:uncharacterized protein LOC110747561 [Prunus avium]|uniref:Uncharacterized protein LOC110747561 n=1 Tax=Prunus avium TaxID=42229 RepID=A0A6P5RK92_PRUAV|nr:uncharacterized protein LOC110747561 [Prunus avium]